MKREERFAEAVGRADMCELLGAAFAFPERRVAEALADGRLSADFASCCSDCGIDRAVVASVEGGLRAYAGRDADGLRASSAEESSSFTKAAISGWETPICIRMGSIEVAGLMFVTTLAGS